MALKAIVDGKLLRAPDFSLDEWRTFQSRKPSVRMNCCNAKGYMRVREGIQEFVHYRRTEDCIGRPDSPAHDLLKLMVVNAAKESGWIADVEVADSSLRRAWIADVLASRNKVRIAFEIQISPIIKEALLISDVLTRTHERPRAPC
jgi:hypothetical protein